MASTRGRAWENVWKRYVWEPDHKGNKSYVEMKNNLNYAS